MQTLKLDTYRKFVKWGRPYYPMIANGKLLCPDFSHNPNMSLKNKVRLVITTTVVVNRGSFTAVHYAIVSKFGTQTGWLYFVEGFRVYWHQLAWDQQRKVVKAFVGLPHSEYIKPPTRAYKRWLRYL